MKTVLRKSPTVLMEYRESFDDWVAVCRECGEDLDAIDLGDYGEGCYCPECLYWWRGLPYFCDTETEAAAWNLQPGEPLPWTCLRDMYKQDVSDMYDAGGYDALAKARKTLATYLTVDGVITAGEAIFMKLYDKSVKDAKPDEAFGSFVAALEAVTRLGTHIDGLLNGIDGTCSGGNEESAHGESD